MTIIKKSIFALTALLAFASAAPSFADTNTDNIIGAGGYDLGSSQKTENKAR
jgi:hypothetical protein